MLKKCRFIPRLETDRLILREITEADTEELRQWLGLDEVYTFWGRPASRDEPPRSCCFAPRPHIHRKPSPDFIWGMERTGDGCVIGTIEVFDVENDGYGMVDCRIAPWLWGMGCCTEALRRVVEFIFTQTPMDRQEGRADVRNTGSNRVLEKCGFTLEGTIRHGKMVSQYCDHHIWGLLRADTAAR